MSSDEERFNVICEKSQEIVYKISKDIEEAVKNMNELERSVFMAAVSGLVDCEIIKMWSRHHRDDYVPQPYKFRKNAT